VQHNPKTKGKTPVKPSHPRGIQGEIEIKGGKLSLMGNCDQSHVTNNKIDSTNNQKEGGKKTRNTNRLLRSGKEKANRYITFTKGTD